MVIGKTIIQYLFLIGIVVPIGISVFVYSFEFGKIGISQFVKEYKENSTREFYINILDGKGCNWFNNHTRTCEQIARCDGLEIPRYLCPEIKNIQSRLNE